MKDYKICYCKGVEGNSIYLNDFRICGNKPWGGGDNLYEKRVKLIDIEKALKMKCIKNDDVDKINELLTESIENGYISVLDANSIISNVTSAIEKILNSFECEKCKKSYRTPHGKLVCLNSYDLNVQNCDGVFYKR